MKEGAQELVLKGIWCRMQSQQIYKQSSLFSSHQISGATVGCRIVELHALYLRESVRDLSDIPVLVAMDRHAIGCPQGNHLTLDVESYPRHDGSYHLQVAFMAHSCQFSMTLPKLTLELFCMDAWYFLCAYFCVRSYKEL